VSLFVSAMSMIPLTSAIRTLGVPIYKRAWFVQLEINTGGSEKTLRTRKQIDRQSLSTKYTQYRITISSNANMGKSKQSNVKVDYNQDPPWKCCQCKIINLVGAVFSGCSGTDARPCYHAWCNSCKKSTMANYRKQERELMGKK
jgi:hypothetical protein